MRAHHAICLALVLGVSTACDDAGSVSAAMPDGAIDCAETDGGVADCVGEVDAEVPLPPPTARGEIRPEAPCPPYPAAEGEVVEVGPDEAGMLAAIINNASPGTTIALADGTYALTEEIVITAPEVTVRGASGTRESVVLDLGYARGSVVSVRAA